MALPELPAQGQNPWYTPRNDWDNAVEAELAGIPQKSLDTSEVAQDTIYPAGSALGAITYESLQSAAVQAATLQGPRKSVRLVAAGTITTNQTLIVNSDFDLSNLAIDYSGTGVAFQFGQEGGLLQNLTMAWCPKVRHTGNVVGTNWVNVPGTVGIRMVNVAQGAGVVVPYVTQFETGFLVDGRNAQPCAWNTVTIGNLYNNKRNMVMDNDISGYTTQNTFIGGRYAHMSAEGIAVPGAEQILIEPRGAGSRNATSNNEWQNPSIEGNVPQYHLSLAGQYNRVINPRLETGVSGTNARIRLYNNASLNRLELGYGGDTVTWTVEAGSETNTIIMPREDRHVATGPSPAVSIEKVGLSTAHLSFFPAGHFASNGTPSGWIMQGNGRGFQGRRGGDAFARSRWDWYEPEIRFGGGTAEPDQGWQYVTGAMRAFGPVAPASYTTAGRPVATGLPNGSQIYDSTLGKTIMAKSGAWTNLDGTAL